MSKTKQRIRVGDTSVGLGVFAEKKFKSGKVIGLVNGSVIQDPLYSSDYAIDLGGDLSLEPGEPFRFLNHSCRPNAEFVICETEEEDGDSSLEVELVALRRIHPGDQITIDYAWPAESAIPCQCGSDHCRGWIVDPRQVDQVPAALSR